MNFRVEFDDGTVAELAEHELDEESRKLLTGLCGAADSLGRPLGNKDLGGVLAGLSQENASEQSD